MALKDGGTHFSTSEMLTAYGSQLGGSLGTVLNKEAPCPNLHPPLGVPPSKAGRWKSIKASPPPIGLNAGRFWRAIPGCSIPENQLEISVTLHLAQLLPLPSLASLTLSYLLLLRAFPINLHTTTISVSVSQGTDPRSKASDWCLLWSLEVKVSLNVAQTQKSFTIASTLAKQEW